MTRSEAINKFFSTLDIQGIDIPNFLDIEDVTDYDSVTGMLEDRGAFDVEVIYYHNAMEFLSEYDNSLRRSLELAEDMGYSPSQLNSEVLASLLKSEIAREEWAEAEDEINEFFEELMAEMVTGGPENLIDTVRFPAWALGALFNGDPLESEEEEEYLRGFYSEYPNCIFSPTQEEYFSNDPCFGLPCNVVDMDIMSMK